MADILAAGTKAPDFSLHVTPDQKLSLSELRGKPVILAFYPADWSPVCGDQMALYNEILPSSPSTEPRCWEFQSMVCGVTAPSLTTAIFISLCWPTSNLKAKSRANMAPIAPTTVLPSAPCSSSTRTV